MQASTKSLLSINLTNTIHCTLVVPWDPAAPNLLSGQNLFQWLLHTNSLSQLMLPTFAKSLQGPQTKTQQSPSVCLVVLGKWPIVQHQKQIVSTCNVILIR